LFRTNGGYLLVNNDPIIWSMVNAIKEQQREIEEQQKLIRTQSSAIEEQRAINGEQEKMLRAQNVAMKSLTAEVRETRKTLREVKAQAAAGRTVMVASK
jgi:septal ring factor EnvC (AmiA/AmiB activator)